MRIRFDHGPDGDAAVFDGAEHEIRADMPEEVPRALLALEAARDAGLWVAGYATYELGLALEPKFGPLMPAERRLPLLRFGAYCRPEAAAPLVGGAARLTPLRPRWSASDYGAAFETVQGYISAGDIYQANLTFPIDLQADGDARALYAALAAAQPVRHGALIEAEGQPAILSRSPELFFRTDARGRIETRPMKGTQPRSSDAAEDARRRYFLQTDEKNRAENLMIVDLLRNDLSRVSEPGSVRVPELFAIESYETVHQMTSLISGQMVPGTGLGDILAALFPCGSITGAPKMRAMEVISELEPWPRDIYCGAIGWAAPDGRAEFNVAIRTILLEGDGTARLNVGGGVVHDSTGAGEYEEALWKARFAEALVR